MQIDNKKLYTSLAAAALVAIAAYAVIGRLSNRVDIPPQDGDPTTSSTQQVRPATSTIQMEIVTLASSSNVLIVRAEYPRFSDYPGLTQQIDSYVAEQVTQFRKTAIDNWEARNATLAPGQTSHEVQFSLDLTWQPTQINSRFISLAMRADAFEGGANVRQEIRTFNWDVRQNKEATLSSLFEGDPSYLARVSEYSRQVLKANLGTNTTDEFLNNGTQPTIASFQAFTFTDDAITLLFPKYQVAPGVAGEQKVVMPRNVPGLF